MYFIQNLKEMLFAIFKTKCEKGLIWVPAMSPWIWNFRNIGVQGLLNVRSVQIHFGVIRRTRIVSNRPPMPSSLHKFIFNSPILFQFPQISVKVWFRVPTFWGATPLIANRRGFLPPLVFFSTHIGVYKLYISMISYTAKYLSREASQEFDGAGLLKLQFVLISLYNLSEITAWSQA